MEVSFDRHSIFAETLFTRRVPLAASPYIKAMHPKTEILPEFSAVTRILRNGWIGQVKIHGHRAQIHIPSRPEESLIAYTRQGKRHKQEIPASMARELYRLFRPEKGWNVIDSEWIKTEAKLYVFDFLKKEGTSLRPHTFPERWALLPRAFISPHITVLPLLRDIESCTRVLESSDEEIEGLVFKSSTSTGFSDTSIVRCRKRK